MWELLIGLGCCLGMAGSLFGYLKWYSKKYKDGKDPSSLSSTFYKTGWKFRVLLISMALLMIYPVLLANGIYTIATLFPGVCYIIAGLIFMFAYPLSKKVVNENSAKLALMREGK